MALIPAYEAKLQSIKAVCKQGGFDVKTRTFTKFSTWDRVEVHDLLDVLATAAEAGALDRDKWVSQVFATTDIFELFLEEYAEYDQCSRTYDRHYWALLALSGMTYEEGFVSSSEIADKLREVAEETGQL